MTFPDGTDLSTYDFFFTVKTSLSVDDTDATIVKDPTDWSKAGNIATLMLDTTDTDVTPKSYRYDFKFTNSATGDVVTTHQGAWVVTDVVTERD